MKLQTQVPDIVYDWLEAKAAAGAATVSQVAREIIHQAYRRHRIAGWILAADRAGVEARRALGPPVFLFELVEDKVGGELLVTLHHGDPSAPNYGVPVTQAYLRAWMGIADNLLEHVAVLSGSPLPWTISRCWLDHDTQCLVLTLRLHTPSREHVSPELVVLAGAESGFFCFIRDPLGRKCRITSVHSGEVLARDAAARWLEDALMEKRLPHGPSHPGYRWVADPAGYPDMHVCVRLDTGTPVLE